MKSLEMTNDSLLLVARILPGNLGRGGFFASLLAASNSKLSSLGRIMFCFLFLMGGEKVESEGWVRNRKKEIPVMWLYVFAWTLRLHESGTKLQMESKMLIMMM